METLEESPLFDQYSPTELTHSLEQLLYGWLYYASESGMNTEELLKPYEAGRMLINQLQLGNGDTAHQRAA